METVLITGANRGIGLELAARYAAAGHRVLACCREPAKADKLQVLAKSRKGLTLHGLHVGEGKSIAALAAEIRTAPIDILINNAGMAGPSGEKQYGRTWTSTAGRKRSPSTRWRRCAWCRRSAASESRQESARYHHHQSDGCARDEHAGDVRVLLVESCGEQGDADGIGGARQRRHSGRLIHPGWVRTTWAVPAPTSASRRARRHHVGDREPDAGRYRQLQEVERRNAPLVAIRSTRGIDGLSTHPETTMPKPTPLSGIRVLDFSRVLAGPHCGRMLCRPRRRSGQDRTARRRHDAPEHAAAAFDGVVFRATELR